MTDDFRPCSWDPKSQDKYSPSALLLSMRSEPSIARRIMAELYPPPRV
jgi:hypothetical protein